MNRRRFVCALALSTSLSGCIEGDFGGSTDRDSPATNATETGARGGNATESQTESPGAATPECYPSMCEGRKLVEVVVAQDFSGDAKLQANCRSEEFSIEPGNSLRIDREEDGETCEVGIHIDGEREFSEEIEDYEHVTLTVTAEGDIEEDWVVV